MKFDHIHFIINPASGREEPILSHISRVVDKCNWDVSVTKKNINAGDIARTLIGKTNLIAVYGGDGSVTEVAAALHGTNTPMAIIPGGTANVMAKELGIPQESLAALQMLNSGKVRINTVDMGLVNDIPFLLRVNMGIMADMILCADRELKDSIGQLAYGVTALKTVIKAEPVNYGLQIDGEDTGETGVSLTITNSGNIGIGDFALQPGISIADGLLDVILLKDNDISSLLKVAGSTLLQNETDAYKHWQCKQVVVRMDKKQRFICDDCEQTAKKLTIKVVPHSLNIVVPA